MRQVSRFGSWVGLCALIGCGGTSSTGSETPDVTVAADLSGGGGDIATEDTSDATPGSGVEDGSDSPDVADVAEPQPDVIEVADASDTAGDDAQVQDTIDTVDVADVSIDVGPDTTDTTDPSKCLVEGTLAAGDTVSGNTASASASYETVNDQCPNEGFDLGGDGAPDNLWAFKAPYAGSFDVTLEAAFDSALYVLTDCDSASTCLADDDAYGTDTTEKVKLSLQQDQVVYIVVDGYSGSWDFDPISGAYSLSVSEGCKSSCDGKSCGDDGCGGTCGSCGTAQLCAEGVCADVGTECAPAHKAVCGAPIAGINLFDPAQATAAFSDFGSCSFSTYAEPEVVATFYAEANESVSLDGFSNARVFVLEDDGTGCNTKTKCIDSTYGTGTFDAEIGKTYYLVFEDDGTTGPFDVDVSCCVASCEGKVCGDDGCGGTCGSCTGNQLCGGGTCMDVATTCAPSAAFACDQTFKGLSMADALQATGAFEKFPGCNTSTYDSPEVVATFIPEKDVTVTLSGFSGVDMFVFKDQGNGCDPAAKCLDTVYSSGSFSAKVGETYYLVFEEYFSGDGDNFDVEVSCCISQCDGKTCGDDGCGGSCGDCESGYCEVDQCVDLPSKCTPSLTVACGDTLTDQTNKAPTSSFAFASYSCQEYSSDDFSKGPEAVYTFVSETDQLVTIEEAGYTNATVTVLEDLGNGCEDAAGSCVVQDYSYGQFEAKAGATYYFVWDSWSSYTPLVDAFDFSVTCCVKTCAAGACGMEDGCGGTCGCDTATQKCGQSQQCEALGEGESCAQPFTIDSAVLPTTVEGDTTFAGTSFATVTDACSDMSAKGANGHDHVYEFKAPEDGIYSFSADCNFDAVVYAMTDCADIGASCLGGVDKNYSKGVEALFVPLSAGQTVFVVVDGYSATALGTYTLTVGAPCHPMCDGTKCGDNSDGCGSTCTCDGVDYCDDAGTCQTPAEGDTCGTAIPYSGADLPLTITGDTSTNYVDQYSSSCSTSYGNGEPDVAYVFTPDVAGSYDFALLNGSGTPQYLSVLTDCEAKNQKCLDSQDFYYSSTPVTLTLEAGVPVYVIVDSFYGEAGPFSLSITSTP